MGCLVELEATGRLRAWRRQLLLWVELRLLQMQVQINRRLRAAWMDLQLLRVRTNRWLGSSNGCGNSSRASFRDACAGFANGRTRTLSLKPFQALICNWCSHCASF